MTRARHAAVVAAGFVPRRPGGRGGAPTTAVVGPVYAAAAGESSLRQVLRTAPAQDTGLHVQTRAASPSTRSAVVDPHAARRVHAGVPPDRPHLQLPSLLQGPGHVPPVVTRVVWREGACAHLRLVAGRCPRGDGEVIASTRTGGRHVGCRRRREGGAAGPASRRGGAGRQRLPGARAGGLARGRALRAAQC